MKKDFQPYKGLDFGFRNLKSVVDFNTTTKPIYDNETYDLDIDGKFKETKILRFRCNQLELITGIGEILQGTVSKFSQIRWLDLSFNDLTMINNDLAQVCITALLDRPFFNSCTKMTELRLLYLHGNNISTTKGFVTEFSLSVLN